MPVLYGVMVVIWQRLRTMVLRHYKGDFSTIGGRGVGEKRGGGGHRGGTLR